MPPRTPHRLPSEPPPTVMEALRKRFAGQDLPALDVVFALRMTAQQVDNAITEWMADTAGTPARFQILVRLWASGAERCSAQGNREGPGSHPRDRVGTDDESRA